MSVMVFNMVRDTTPASAVTPGWIGRNVAEYTPRGRRPLRTKLAAENHERVMQTVVDHLVTVVPENTAIIRYYYDETCTALRIEPATGTAHARVIRPSFLLRHVEHLDGVTSVGVLGRFYGSCLVITTEKTRHPKRWAKR